MSHPRGTTEFKAGGATYRLRYSIDAICEMEQAAGKGFVAISQELANPKTITVSTVRAVLWAGLREHHPNITLKQAGELIADAGGLAKIVEPIGAAMAASFPEAEASNARPLKAVGTGSNS